MGYWAIAYIPTPGDYINAGPVPPGINNGLPWHPAGRPDQSLPIGPGHPSTGPIYGGGHPGNWVPGSWGGSIDNSLPGGGYISTGPIYGGRPDQGLPWGPGRPDNSLPGYIPPCYNPGTGADNELPAPPAVVWPIPAHPSQPIYIPPGTVLIPSHPIALPGGDPNHPIQIPPGTPIISGGPIIIPPRVDNAPPPTATPK